MNRLYVIHAVYVLAMALLLSGVVGALIYACWAYLLLMTGP